MQTNKTSDFPVEKPPGFLIVGIVASAGGVQALKEFFQHVPEKSNMAYVVILPSSHDHDSHLAQVLHTATAIPVSRGTEKTKIDADHIYVVSPKEHLVIDDGLITPSINLRTEGGQAAVDVFFRNLADTYGPRTVAVILSGTGANASMGLKRVKEMGGLVFVQNPGEAEFDEMARYAIANGLADEVLPVTKIPGKIMSYKNNVSKMEMPEARLHTLADAIPQLIWTNDAAGKAEYFNQRWYDYSGLSFAQLEGLGWQGIVHPDDAPASGEKWQKALETGEVFDTEYRLRRYDGSYHWFIGRNVPLKDATGRITGWFGSATDIENLKKTQEALSLSEARLRVTMETATDYGIITMDTERRIERWSSGATHLFGYVEAEVIGQSADIIFTEEDRKAGAPQKEMEAARDTGRAIDERWHRRKDDSRFYVSGVMRPIKNKELTGYVKVMRDMTQQQLFTEELTRLVNERTLELQRSNDDLRQFAHVASHDLKEPVRKIKTFNNRLKDEYGNMLPEKAHTYLNKIEASANRMVSMIEGVLAYSLLGRADKRLVPVDINKTIEEIESTLEVLIDQKKATIIKTELPVIKGNPTLIFQLFYNLILNSLKFSKKDEPPRITLSSEIVKQEDADVAKIVIADNGIGFEPEYQQMIFETFARLHPMDEYEGTGLGLALCKKIVERHGGSILATGQLNKGASFTIILPL